MGHRAPAMHAKTVHVQQYSAKNRFKCFLHRLFIQSCNRYSTDTEIQKEMSEVGQSTSRLPQCRYKKGLLDDKMLALFLILFMSCLPVDHLERLAQIPPLLDKESLIHFQ